MTDETSKKRFTLTGIANWASTKSPNKLSGKYQLDLTVDAETAESLTEMGIDIKTATKPGDTRGTFVTLKSMFPPEVVDSELQPMTVEIGPGSKVNVTSHIYRKPFNNKIWTCLGLDAVQVLELVEFVNTKTSLFTKQGGS